MFNGRVRVSQVLADPHTDQKTRAKLESVEEILDFAHAAGLETEGAYRYYIDIGGAPVSYLVKAAEPFELRFKTWWFPFTGSVPYLGYFSKPERDRNATELKEQGYDVFETNAAAFSSLGWFEDPIYSSMLERSEAGLAQLFFHELTHRTVWISSRADVNENLAEFVGNHLTEIYLERKGMKKELANFKALLRDERRFLVWLGELKGALEAFYSRSAGEEASKRKLAKQAIFDQYLTPGTKPSFEHYDFTKSVRWNNATVLSFGLYGLKVDDIAAAFRCSRQPLRAFLDAIEALASDESDALDDLKAAFCAADPSSGIGKETAHDG